jgi:predicted unusual protein kinase regulating ubiquinone biosynthesis (AarF/ABC1/UbiB family)
MPTTMVHAQLDASFPAGWRRLFREFDDRPAAAASVGQVHRAVMADGTRAAVKIQYPGAGDALMADIGMLDRLVPVLRAAMPGMDAKRLFAELQDRLADEVDYVMEADAQTAFADAYRDDKDIVVPDVLAVEDRVLITRWVDGTPLSSIVDRGTQEQRDRTGLLLVRLLLSSPARAGRLHGARIPATSVSCRMVGSRSWTSARPRRCQLDGPLDSGRCSRRGRTATPPSCTDWPPVLGC